MTDCPCCGEALQVDNSVWDYVDTYSTSAVATSLCCGNFVTVRPVRRYVVSATTYHHDNVDDWGVPGKIYEWEK